jgi:glycosyltransferase involved in cell wall biosynthesis
VERTDSDYANLNSYALVSVVIPVYKMTEFIPETLKSVFDQVLFQNFEVIVINDCCPDSDNLERVLSPFLTRIKYLRMAHNVGPSAARNCGIREARGELIALLDGDDVWEPNYLAVQVGMLRDDPKACLVYGNARIMGSIYDGMLSQDLSPSTGAVTIDALLRQTVTVALLNLVRKQTLLDAGLFDEHIRGCEDFDMWLRIVLGGGKIIYHSQVIAGYRRRDDSLSADPMRMLQARLYTLRQLEQDPRLENQDRPLIKLLTSRCTAEADLEIGKRAFLAGANLEGATHIQRANTHYNSTKLRLIAALMSQLPGFLRLLTRIRLKLRGY